jgi:hypothetical protein
MKLIFFSILITLSVLFPTVILAQANEKKLIIGTWTAENVKYVFNSDMKSYLYHKGKVISSYKYRISNTSPQCGEKVTVDSTTSFLELTNLKNGEKECYIINGVDKTTLSLTGVGYADPSVYTRAPTISNSRKISKLKIKKTS